MIRLHPIFTLFPYTTLFRSYFDFATDYYFDRQEVLNRVNMVSLFGGVQPQLSPWSAIAEIYRYELTGPPELSLSEIGRAHELQSQSNIVCRLLLEKKKKLSA